MQQVVQIHNKLSKTLSMLLYCIPASEPDEVHVVIDRNIITGQNLHSTMAAVQNLILICSQKQVAAGGELSPSSNLYCLCAHRCGSFCECCLSCFLACSSLFPALAVTSVVVIFYRLRFICVLSMYLQTLIYT